jgi:hypothetical protein
MRSLSDAEKELLDPKHGMFYWAYGSNLNVKDMTERCPGAIKIQPLRLNSCALVFRGVADVVNRKNSRTWGGLWWINREHECTLDTYEGVNCRFYLKRYMNIRFAGIKEPARVLYYQMSMRRGVMPPSEFYLNCIAQGYRDFGLPLEALEAALEEAWEDKKVTPVLRVRHARRGGNLARELERPIEGIDIDQKGGSSC